MQSAPHILIVDDHGEIRDLVSRALVKEGFRVSVAADGHAMHEVLADNRIDLILLDVMLPGENGLSLCRTLRAESNIPIIMLTAKGDDRRRHVALLKQRLTDAIQRAVGGWQGGQAGTGWHRPRAYWPDRARSIPVCVRHPRDTRQERRRAAGRAQSDCKIGGGGAAWAQHHARLHVHEQADHAYDDVGLEARPLEGRTTSGARCTI